MESQFYYTEGTVWPDAACYVERRADKDLLRGLAAGEFCFVLTSRQMGKSSLMVRSASVLRRQQRRAVVLDLTAIGKNLTPEQWYGGLASKMATQLQLEDVLDRYWSDSARLGPVQRFFSALREVVLARLPEPVVVFVDEVDAVRGLPFETDEFFSAIKECHNRRTEDPELNRLTFCLLGVATPAELIRNPRTTPFNVGRQIELTDFTAAEAAPLAQHLAADARQAERLLHRILHWTSGHPYLTQQLCLVTADPSTLSIALPASQSPEERVDQLAEHVFLNPRAREKDDNLNFVRQRILRTEADLTKLLELYALVHAGKRVDDDETNDLINQLRLAGIVAVRDGALHVRNQIYRRVFDDKWIDACLPDAEIEQPDGTRLRIRGTCSLGRTPTNLIVLGDPKVSRHHALIQCQQRDEFWLMDLGSSNGTFLNGRRLTRPLLLRNEDVIELGPFRLVFRQFVSSAPATSEDTVITRYGI